MIARTERTLNFRPRLLLAYSDPAYAALASRHFRRRGWEVHTVGKAADVRRLAFALAPRIVVLDVNLSDESGWLTCAKLLLDRPELRVVLVAPEQSELLARQAAFIGAAGFISREQGCEALFDEAVGALPAVSSAS